MKNRDKTIILTPSLRPLQIYLMLQLDATVLDKLMDR